MFPLQTVPFSVTAVVVGFGDNPLYFSSSREITDRTFLGLEKLEHFLTAQQKKKKQDGMTCFCWFGPTFDNTTQK